MPRYNPNADHIPINDVLSLGPEDGIVSLQMIHPYDPPESLVGPDVADEIVASIPHGGINDALSYLTPDEADLIGRVLDAENQWDVYRFEAQLLGCSPQNVYKFVQGSFKRLSKVANIREIIAGEASTS